MTDSTPLWIISGVIVLFAVMIPTLVITQSRSERKIADRSPDDDWALFPANLRSEGFTLWRILPTAKWTVAEFIIQDEYRREVARFALRSRFSATITLGERTIQQFIQRQSRYTGKVGGTSNSSIVFRDGSALIAEVFTTRFFPRRLFSMIWRAHEYVINPPTLAVRALACIRCDDQTVGAFRRSGILSRTVLIALQPDLDPELKVLLSSLALLR